VRQRLTWQREQAQYVRGMSEAVSEVVKRQHTHNCQMMVRTGVCLAAVRDGGS